MTSNTAQATASELERAYRACEQLAGRDKPHLYAAAGLFKDERVRRAFVATYASMRVIDDAVDDIPNRASLSAERRREEQRRIEQWLGNVRAAHDGRAFDEPIWLALADTFTVFRFPLDPWLNLAKAMLSDVHSSSFESWDELRQYMQGASVAPAVVFMYLVLMKPDPEGIFRTDWSYEQVHAATEDLAVFCYCVHILRDVAVDLSLGESGLVYLPRDEMKRFGIDASDLYRMRERGSSEEKYRKFAQFQADRAWAYLERGRSKMPDVLASSDPAHGLALTVLVNTYQQVLDELQDRDFDVFSKSPREK